MDTWLLALDCVINAAILGWLVYEYKHVEPVKVVLRPNLIEIDPGDHNLHLAKENE